MTGTGIQTDPYIITTVEELYSVSELGECDVYFRLGADIDFNGTPYAEKFEAIPIKCCEFDGDGHCIRNIYVNSDDVVHIFAVTNNSNGTAAMIKNLRLENIELVGASVNLFYGYSGNMTINLYNCTFLLNLTHITTDTYIYGSCCCFHNNYVSINYELCTMSIRGSMRCTYPILRNGTFIRSHLCLDLDIEQGLDTYIQSMAVFDNTSMTDSYLTGSISYHDEGDENYFQIANYLCTAQNFYMAIELTGRSEFYCDMATKTDCFFDSELMGGAVHKQYNGTSCNKFHALTTAQCKDADYLNSIGFICAGDSP